MNCARILRLTAAIAVITVYIAAIARYQFSPGLLDHVEATVCCDAWIWSHGQPLYHSPNDASRYSTVYGPDAFIAVVLPLKILGASIRIAKLPGTIAAILSAIFCALTFQPLVGARRAIEFVAMIVVGWLCFRHFTYWVRPDPLELLCVSGALLAVSRGNRIIAILVLALASGIIANLKIHAIVLMLPIAAMMWNRLGWKAVAVSVVAGLAIFISPFLLSGISLTNYLTWLSIGAREGIDPELAARALMWLGLLLAVMFSSLRICNRNLLATLAQDRAVGWILIACIVTTAIVASKTGAGAHHLAPLFPIVAFFCATNESRRIACQRKCWSSRILLGAVLLLLIGLMIPSVWLVWRLERWVGSIKLEEELSQLLRAHPKQQFEMGWGGEENYRYVNARPVLVLAGNPYLIDPTSAMDCAFTGQPISPATIATILSQSRITWLIPRGGAPFTLTDPFDPSRTIVPDSFAKSFVEQFHQDGSTAHFDLWVSSEQAGMTDK